MDTAPETSELQAFVAAAEGGSISAAAEALTLPRATVSRRLTRLEERLDAKLVLLSSRKMALTDAGEALLPHARSALGAVEQAAQAVLSKAGPPRGRLRLSTMPLDWGPLRRMVAAFVAHHPHVRLELSCTNRYEDLLADQIDLALRAGPELSPGLICRRLATTELWAMASPAYLEANGTPEGVDELAAHRCLLGFRAGEHPETHWPLRGGGTVRVEPALASNDIMMLAEAARAGQGIALLPSIVVRPELADGALRPVLTAQVGRRGTLGLVFPDRQVKPAVRAFVDFVVTWVKTHTDWMA